MTDLLDYYCQAWDRKRLLRRVYNDIYDRIAAVCVEGRTLEIGGGIGNFKSRFPQVIATDIQSAPWLDVVADAQKLPFTSGSISNIVMVDVLHHLEFPAPFLARGRACPTTGRAMHHGGARHHPGQYVILSLFFIKSRSA